MPDNNTFFAQGFKTLRSDNPHIAYHRGRYYRPEEFLAAVNFWAERFKYIDNRRAALYTADAYPFAVLLFGLLTAGKEVWIPGDNLPGTARKLPDDCCKVGDWDAAQPMDYNLTVPGAAQPVTNSLQFAEAKMVIFTSGSTGAPKAIPKTLAQLHREILTLESCWGVRLADSEILATVSHQHIYGLLFRVLWPLLAGRCFHSEIYSYPEALLQTASSRTACWIASPAHLKRLAPDLSWPTLSKLTAVFSSGGLLPAAAAKLINENSRQAVIEVYGSSETGGIGWRQQPEQSWQLFPGMQLLENAGRIRLDSPYLSAEEHVDGFALEDSVTLLADRHFILHGRADRIVKVEEQRLSLTELEQALSNCEWIAEAQAVLIKAHRDVVAVAVVLTATGRQQLDLAGRRALLAELKTQLEPSFDAVVLPRKWLFSNALPLTTQGKVRQDWLPRLLDNPRKELPQVLNVLWQDQEVLLEIKVPHDLSFFADHFPGHPILPGVVQLAWVAHFGKLCFSGQNSWADLSDLEAVKFSRLIRPDDEMTLALKWDATQQKLFFRFSDATYVYSSGRLLKPHPA